MKKILVLLCLFGLLYACQKKVEPPIRDYKKEFNDYFVDNFSSLGLSTSNTKVDSLHWVQNVYKLNDYQPIWAEDSLRIREEAHQLIELLLNARNYGLETNHYDINNLLAEKSKLDNVGNDEERLAALSALEVLLSANYMKFGRHLNVGTLNFKDTVSELPRKKFNVNLPEYLLEASQKDSLIPFLKSLQPKHMEYVNLQHGMEQYLKNANLSTENVEVFNFRIDSLQSVELAKKALVLHQYLPEIYKDSLYLNALTRFQQDHALKADSLIGHNTAKALSFSPYAYYQKIKAGLERWRWKEEWTSEKYVYVNIPSYQLRVYGDSKLLKENRAVVGSRKDQTPELVDTLEYIIAYPYWNVPKRISVEEILVKAQKDSSYMTRNQYQVRLKGESIHPDSINWNAVTPANFKYRIRQNGGGYNALGMVKFIFPNKDAIYFHDTPSKSHFYREIRAYSHGCIRVQNALGLADFFLDQDKNKYTKDSLRNFIKRKKEKWINLNSKIPVHLYYIPTEADETGKITFYQDVYNLDKDLIKHLSVEKI